ncbi:MAG: DNA polymerase III subunit chi [bacterium]
MTRVDFYVLKDGARDNRFGIACRLAEKAWQQGHRVYVHTGSPEESIHLDRLMWTYREQSFVPHGILGDADSNSTPILIGNALEPANEHDVLINLALDVPPFFSRFDRVAECVDADANARQASRERYRYYRDHGYPLGTHELN